MKIEHAVVTDQLVLVQSEKGEICSGWISLLERAIV